MRICVFVITPGTRRSALGRAQELLNRAAPAFADWWGVGWYNDWFGKIDRPELTAWYKERSERIRRGSKIYIGDEAYSTLKEPVPPARVRRLEREAKLDSVRLTRQLPRPLPQEMIPIGFITPDGLWYDRNKPFHEPDPAWDAWVNATIDRYRGRALRRRRGYARVRRRQIVLVERQP